MYSNANGLDIYGKLFDNENMQLTLSASCS